jgi:hypothetical protein
MKRFILIPITAASLLLGACSTINSRINEKGSVYYNLDEQTRAKIAHGDIAVGFTPDMVYMALGKPDTKRYRTSADGTSETWIYGGYYYDNLAFAGYHRWGGWGPRGFYRMYWEPVYAPYSAVVGDETRVTFRSGKVVSIDQAHS